ncbi:gamma-glutamyltransferase family protein [Natrarchaeobius chitinivorans]|uniref:Gamma-glutamyltransferase family protein n=1 Tax=Natrarchaeobius chitinivorans TaxID=1679083 RepID=A0A3N6LV58_NATCH|nr:gamma-glutamyltransferase family protein [Natrarchaeobius chitinivorans]RQG94258.1 gamma-glutamyltransferase family protein [Natrarchaeobius chitinivorans]
MAGSPAIDVFESRRSTVYGTRGVVSTSQPLAAQAGIQALRDGGNAFDAAVTTAATLAVVEPHMTGIGGDVFALYRTADGDVGGMQSGGPAPQSVSLEELRSTISAESDDGSVEIGSQSPHAVTVPGTVRGWDALLERFGRRTLSPALEPAIEYATDGYPVSEIIASDWAANADTLDERARETYLIDGRPPRAGEFVTLPELGESLKRIATDGADVFYEGEIADEIVRTIRDLGGFLSAKDLAEFEPRFVDPVSTTYGDATVYELPPHNQGLLAIEALNVADELDVDAHSPNSPERVHGLVESMKVAFRDGHHYVTDPDFEEIPPLDSKAYAARRADAIGDSATENPSIGTPNPETEDADTVLLTVADKAGNVVSFINSVFASFGSGIAAGDTGILLQNRGRSFSLDPSDPNRFEPGKQPFHTLIPGLVRRDTDDWTAFGVMGGFMQPQGHLQVLSHLLDSDDSLQRACDRPRWRYREDGTLSVESRMDHTLVDALLDRGHDVRVERLSAFGGAQIARWNDGVLSGASDPRKDGTTIGF